MDILNKNSRSAIAKTRRLSATQMQWLTTNLEKTLAGMQPVFNWYGRRDVPDIDLECTIDDVVLYLNIADRNGMLIINNIQTYFHLTTKNWQVIRKKILRHCRK